MVLYPWRWVTAAAAVGGLVWYRDDLTRAAGWLVSGWSTGRAGSWWPLVLVALGVLVGYLYDVWRRPDKACWWCCGAGRVFASSWFSQRRTSGVCRECGGQAWQLRWVARKLGWTRNSTSSW